MSAPSDTALAAITDARALLIALRAGGWRELHLVSGGLEIFIGSEGAGPNPMRAPRSAAPAPEAGASVCVHAPHVATLVAVAPPGTRVAKGEAVATLSVLDDEMSVPSPVAAIVGAGVASAGALIEFDQPILWLQEVA